MARYGHFAVVAALAWFGGCAAPAKYIERNNDSGVVAVPHNTDAWPNYNRRAAVELIEKHVGHDYEILDERAVTVGHTPNSRNVTRDFGVNPRNPALVAQRETVNENTPPRENTQWQISYRRKAPPAPRELLSQEPSVVPASGTQPTVTTRYPSVTPPARPVLPSVFNRGSSTAPATGGSDCNH